ncbi:hypothetical protein RAA17_11030 [Komagataeibacter rhaeticus]|nr:hypothetical protein [Komagataeibacter rhaeticus]
MRMISMTSRPTPAKASRAAGPAAAMTALLPTNRPAPMAPPKAIMMIWRCLRLDTGRAEGRFLTGVIPGIGS